MILSSLAIAHIPKRLATVVAMCTGADAVKVSMLTTSEGYSH